MIRDFRAQLEELAAQRVRLAAEECCEAAKGRAPVETGRLRDSLRVESDGLTARVVTDCSYAAAVEFGTSKRAPQPFLRG